MNNSMHMIYIAARAPLMFMASFLGLMVFWVSLIVMINVAPVIGLPIKGFMDSVTLFIWRSEENINFFRHFAIALTVFYPAVPGLLIKLTEFFHEVYLYRVKKVVKAEKAR